MMRESRELSLLVLYNETSTVIGQENKNNCLTRGKRHLNKMKRQDESGVLLFLSKEKNFVQGQESES